MKRINKITIKHIFDTSPDLDYLGTYDNEAKDEFAIDREALGDMRSHEYRYFNPQKGMGNTPREQRKYAKEAYQRMEAYERGEWHCIGVQAVAEIAVKAGNSTMTQEITSGSLWGIESDSDAATIKEVEGEQVDELADQLKAFGFTTRQIKAAPVEHKEE